MTPAEELQSSEEMDSEENCIAPVTTNSVLIRVKNITELNGNNEANVNNNEAEATTSAPLKRRCLPSWMLPGAQANVSSKKKREQIEKNEQPESSELSQSPTISSPQTHDESPSPNQNSHNENSISQTIENEQTDSEVNAHASGDPIVPSTSNHSSSTIKVKEEPIDDNTRTVGEITSASLTDIKPAVKVEKEEATSSTSRISCKFGIRCYRQNPIHRREEAHPGDTDYRRPEFPSPPAGTPECPFGDLCYRRNPVHFQQYSHPDTCDFQQNWKNHKMRLRKRQSNRQVTSNSVFDDDEEDDYDFEDPFINDGSSDEDFVDDDEEDGNEDEDEE